MNLPAETMSVIDFDKKKKEKKKKSPMMQGSEDSNSVSLDLLRRWSLKSFLWIHW